MTLRRSLLIQGILLMASVAFSIATASRLPATVVTHWGLNGQADGWGSKWTILLLMPIVQAAMAILTVVLPAVSPKKSRVERFGKTYAWVMVLTGALMAAMHTIIVLKTAGAAFDIGRAMFAALFAFWASFGILVGRVGRNYLVGIRTPWTLSDERVWRETHRVAGRLWVAGGVLGLFGALAGAPTVVLIAYLLVIALAPVAQSYAIYKRLRG